VNDIILDELKRIIEDSDMVN